MTAPATIDSQDLSERLGSAAPPRVIDVRTPGEFEAAHIAGAYNVPLDLLREHRDEIINHLDENAALVCRSGPRAAQAEETLRAAGLDMSQVLRVALRAFGPPEPSPTGWRSDLAARVAGAPLAGGHAAPDGVDVHPTTRPGGLAANAALDSTTHGNSLSM
jgi:rhodanese-related sulfurtransferase